MADLMDEAIEISHKLIPCNICGRTFLPSPLKKHAKVCEKNATRKRKTFNSLKQRIEGTELAVFHQKSFLRKGEHFSGTSAAAAAAGGSGGGAAAAQPATQPTAANQEKRNQSKWKEKHEELVQAIRAAKGEKIMAPRRSISAVGSMGTTEQCPSCDRHFGPKAYDRHVEWCKEHKIRASKSPAVVTIAKERLEARTKYRVPPLTKSKRSVTREKYASPSKHRHQEAAGLNVVRSTSSLDQSTNRGKPRSHKSNAAQNYPAFVEPVIKHNAEKLKSFGGKNARNDRKTHPLSPLKRSVSLSNNPVVKARSMKNKQDIQDYLHVREQKTPSREKLKALSPPRSSDELFPVGHDMYGEYKKYEEMYRQEQQDSEREHDANDDEMSSTEDCTPPLPERNYQYQQKQQAGDSAYGSLNRKSPKVQQVSAQHPRQPKGQHAKRSPSSSGSETCTSLPAKKSNRLTKFCHECGTKYPLDCAKFCVECGIKRLVL